MHSRDRGRDVTTEFAARVMSKHPREQTAEGIGGLKRKGGRKINGNLEMPAGRSRGGIRSFL